MLYPKFQIYVYKLCTIMGNGIAPQTTVLNLFLSTRTYVKIALISHPNDFCLIPLGKCASWRRATIDAKKFKF